jgi:hypothetical protein
MLSPRALILGPALVLGGLGLGPRTAAGASAHAAPAPSAPTCTPTTLNNSALQAGSVTISPQPGSRDATAQTQISFLGVPAGELSAVSVVGSVSGAHPGRLAPYSLGDGASFLPARSFVEGERVTVHARVRIGGVSKALLDRFAIAHQDPISSTPEPIHQGDPREVQGFHSRPDLHPPAVTVTAHSAAVSPGEEFVAPYSGPGQAGPMILYSNGGLVWFKPLPTSTSAANLRVQEYDGRPVLTWWQGDISVHGFGIGEDVIADTSYTDIAHVRAGNGLAADLHDLQLTPQGTALVTAYDPIDCNTSTAGGLARSAVTNGVLQEVDVKTGLVMFQWTGVDHVALSESHEQAAKASTQSPFDFFHINSIGLERDGEVLVSARNTWAVYSISPQSGQIVWSLGGRHSSFRMGAGTGTAWQHDPRELANGSISIFDNGASPGVHGQSRGIVLSLNPRQKTATLVSRLTHPSPLLADSQGNMQALPNGDWFVGWGQLPDFSEFSARGLLLFDAHFPAQEQSYRSLRFEWSGTPAHPPAFTVQPAAGGSTTVYASWNGATLVTAWRVLAGPAPTSLQAVAQAGRTGFETAIPLPSPTVGPYVTVQALDATGAVIGTGPVTRSG